MNAFDLIIKDNISSNDEFYYKVKFPVSLNPSAFGCKIAFFDRNDHLLYHNQKAYAHEVNDPADIDAKRIESEMFDKISLPKEDPILRIATWSKQGNVIYIVEYFRFQASYFHVFINLKEKYQLRALHGIDRGQFYTNISAKKITELGFRKPNFDEVSVLKAIEEMEWKRESLIKDPLNTNFLADMLPRNRWYR